MTPAQRPAGHRRDGKGTLDFASSNPQRRQGYLLLSLSGVLVLGGLSLSLSLNVHSSTNLTDVRLVCERCWNHNVSETGAGLETNGSQRFAMFK